jgi:Phage integrase family
MSGAHGLCAPLAAFAALGCGPGLEFYDPPRSCFGQKGATTCLCSRSGSRASPPSTSRGREVTDAIWQESCSQFAGARSTLKRRSFGFAGAALAGTVRTPKNRERRDVDLTSDVVELLARLRGECGIAHRENLVFPNADRASFLTPTVVLRRHLYPAMAHAGVERVGPTLEKRTFHSFRHTFVKRAFESGAQITWLSRHLGHSTLEGDDRHLRPLGARRAQAPSRQNGGRISRVMRMRTRPVLHRGAGTLTAREERPPVQALLEWARQVEPATLGLKAQVSKPQPAVDYRKKQQIGRSLLRRS